MKIVAVEPFDKSIVPGICVTVEHEYEENVVAVVTSGYAVAADRKIVGDLVPLAAEIPASQERSDTLWQYAPDSVSAQARRQQTQLQQEYFCALGGRTLEHLENLRLTDPKKDVHISFILTSIFTRVDVKMGDFAQGQNMGGNNFSVISSYGQGNRSNSNLRILVGPEQRLFEVRRLASKLSHIIKASDWIHDFAPTLGLGRFLVVEILQPDVASIEASALAGEVKEFLDRLDRAGGILGQMGKDLKGGEWREVVRKSREFWELFHQESNQLHVRDFIKRLVTETTGIEDDKSGNMVQGISRLYGYASDLLHPVGGSGVKEVFVGGKEDAYLSYSLAASFLNVLVSKFKLSLRK